MADLLGTIYFIYLFYENLMGGVDYPLVVSLFALVIEKLN
jgi:hypothetical protein